MAIIETMDGIRHDLTKYGFPILKVAPVDIIYDSENIKGRAGRNRVTRYHGIRKLQLKLLVQAADETDSIMLRDKLAEILDDAVDFYIYEQVSRGYAFEFPGESSFKRASDQMEWVPHLFKRWRVERINNDAIEWDGLKGTRVIEFETSDLPYAVTPYTSLELAAHHKEWDDGLIAWGMGFEWDDADPTFTFASNNFAVTNYGSVAINPRYMPLRIELRGTFVSYVQIENLTTGELFRYDGPLNDGDELVLDGVSFLKNGQYVTGTTNKKLISLNPKENQFVITGGNVQSITFDFPFYYL